jgi:uncharacterized membrane protein YeaQ/YmgE (transglycosylase-associated protein family)
VVGGDAGVRPPTPAMKRFADSVARQKGIKPPAGYFVTPGDNEPSGFVLTTILGIVGAFVATYLGQAIGWYRADEGAGLIGAVVGAVIILLIWGFIAGRRRPSP